MKDISPAFVAECNDLWDEEELSDSEWIFVVCRADYEPGRIETWNHWVPGFSPKSLGEGVYNALTAAQDAANDEKMMKLLSELNDVEAGSDSKSNGLDFESALALGVSLHEQIARHTAWQTLTTMCRARGFTPVEVPCDGDCLLWSVLTLDKQAYLSQDKEGVNIKAVEFLRKKLVQNWKIGQNSPAMQQLFHHLHVPEAVGPAEPEVKDEPRTPTRPKRPWEHGENVDLCTPPDASEKQPMKVPRRIAQCRRAPGWSGPQAASPTLLSKGSGASAPVGKTRQVKQAAGRGGDADEPEVPEVPEGEEMQTDAKPPQKRRKRKEKQAPDARGIKMKKLQDYCSHKEIDYQTWQQAHWRMAGSKKAGACEQGLWKDLKSKLVDGGLDQVTCEACQGLLSSKGFCPRAFETFEPKAEPGATAENAEDAEDAEVEPDAEEACPAKSKSKKRPIKLDDFALDAAAKKVSVHYQAFSIQEMRWCYIYSLFTYSSSG